MIGYFYYSEEKIFFPRYEIDYPMGLPLLKVAIPPQYSPRRLQRTANRLYRKGLRRYLTGEPALRPEPLTPVSPLPLCRAKGAELALTLLPGVPLGSRRVALRGKEADPAAWALAEALCPKVSGLLLDFDRGEEALGRHLRARYGAAPLHLGQGPPPQASVELDPRPSPSVRPLRLWGEPELQGLMLTAQAVPPAGVPELPFLELLWETGRITAEEIAVCRREE